MMAEESSAERSVNSVRHLRRRDAHDDEGEEADQRGGDRDHRRRAAPRPALLRNSTRPCTERAPADSAPNGGRPGQVLPRCMVSIWLTTAVNARRYEMRKNMRKTGFARRGRRFVKCCDEFGSAYWRYCWMRVVRRPARPCWSIEILPGQEFVDRQRVAAAGLFERKQAAANGSDDLGLAANDPALGAGRGQIRDRQRTAVRPDDVLDPRAMGFGHGVLTNSQPLNSREQDYAARDLKFA